MKAIKHFQVIILVTAALGLFQNCSGVGFSAAALSSTEPEKTEQTGPTPPPVASATPPPTPPPPAEPLAIKSIVFALDIHGGSATVTTTFDHDASTSTSGKGVRMGYLTSNSRLSTIRLTPTSSLGATVGYRIAFKDPTPTVSFALDLNISGGVVDWPSIHLELTDGRIIEAPGCTAPFASVYDLSAASSVPNGTPSPYKFQCDLGSAP